MIKHFIVLLFASLSIIFPRGLDSLEVINDSTDFFIKPDSTVAINNTVNAASDDSLNLREALIPLEVQPLTETSFIISKKDFLFDDYRYAGDFLKQFPLTFTRDLGFAGYPIESFIYGTGDGGVSYLINGVLWNDRYFNSSDLNLIQSEEIDSVEIVPLPRGFLYGSFNNNVSVNFITKDFLSQKPYTRIKYYEGPDGEAMIDGMFNAQIMKQWNLSFGITNRGKDSVYANTEFSLWQANAKLKYLLSNEINFFAEYRFNHLVRGLSGGIDVDSIQQITSNIESTFYDPLQAPVVSPNMNQDLVQNSIVFRTLAKPFENSKLNLSFYYKHGLNEIRDFRDTTNISEDYQEKIYGVSLDYYQRFGAVSLQVLSLYEIQDDYNKFYEVFASNSTEEYNYFDIAGIFNLHLLNDHLLGSIFIKHNNLSPIIFNSNKFGQGLDVKYNLLDLLSFYFGISRYDNENNREIKTFEVG